jgi:hypothetical protein
MNDIQKRFLLFLIGCIGVRLSLVYVAKNYKDQKVVKNILLIFTILVSLGFFFIYFTGIRKKGTETFGSDIWWNNLRPLHGFLYLLFAILLYQNKSYAWMVLLADVLIGLSAFLMFHYNAGNFSQLV